MVDNRMEHLVANEEVSSGSSEYSLSEDEEEQGSSEMAYGPLPIPNPVRVTFGELAGAPLPPATRYASSLRRSYSARLSTFPQTWPHGQQDVAETAKNGFYFTGLGFRVKCAFCGIVLDRRNAFISVVPRHYALAPRCPILNLTYQLNFDTMIGSIYRSLGIAPNEIPTSNQFISNGRGGGVVADGISTAPVRQAVERAERTEARQVTAEPEATITATPTNRRSTGVSSLWNLDRAVRQRTFGPSSASTERCQQREVNTEEEETRPNMECKICLSNTCNTVFFPCKHLVCCSVCAKRLTTCCICREPIKAATKVFF